MEFLMPGLQRRRLSLVGQALALLEWLLLLVSRVSLANSTGCRFPAFLQSSDEGMGNWTCKYGERAILRMEVMGGEYLIFMDTNSNRTYGGPPWTERVYIKRRRCAQQIGEDMFIVEHVVSSTRPTYQCVQFIRRSSSVVQMNLSRALVNWTNICQLNLTLDEFPWISLKNYRNAIAPCPFNGGLYFHDVSYHTKGHVKSHHCPNSPKPVRVESDCVEEEGIHFELDKDHCVYEKLRSSHFLCMAAWEDKEHGESFAMLRSANGDRRFYCLRIYKDKGEVIHMHLFLDWVCYRKHDLWSPNLKLQFATPYIKFKKAEKKIISYPCNSNTEECSYIKEDCEGDKCVNTTSIPCEFLDEALGKWEIRHPKKNTTTLQIVKNGINYPNLGFLRCVSFNDQTEAKLRAILSGIYRNGCFPRFVCLHFEMKNELMMRYRMGDFVEWPLALSDDNICHEDNFQIRPDITIPTDIYHSKPWVLALRTSRSIPSKHCVLPSHMPRHSSVITNDNRRGCITLRPDSAPSTISISFFEDDFNSMYSSRSGIFTVEKFDCITTLTYTSIITMSPGNQSDFLCWVMLNPTTIVVIKTSACNEWTAQQILHGREKYIPNMKFSLTLGAGGEELVDTCARHYKKEQSAWKNGYESTSLERQKARDQNSSAFAVHYGDCMKRMLLNMVLSLVAYFVCRGDCYALPFTDLVR